MDAPFLGSLRTPSLLAITVDGKTRRLRPGLNDDPGGALAASVEAVLRRDAQVAATIELELAKGARRCLVRFDPSQNQLTLRGDEGLFEEVERARTLGTEGAEQHLKRALDLLEKKSDAAKELAEWSQLNAALARWRATAKVTLHPRESGPIPIVVGVLSATALAVTGLWLGQTLLLIAGAVAAAFGPLLLKGIDRLRRLASLRHRTAREEAERDLRQALTKNRVLPSEGPLDEAELTRCLDLAEGRRTVAAAADGMRDALRALRQDSCATGWPLALAEDHPLVESARERGSRRAVPVTTERLLLITRARRDAAEAGA